MKTIIVRMANLKIILILFAGLGVLYSLATPIFEASDEVSHYAVIQNIVDGQGLPVQQVGVHTAWEQEGSQPPLYYVLMAVATKWIDTGDAAERMYRNPHAAPGDPSLDANRNLVIHSDAENFPWRGTTLAVHFIRLLSIVLGALTVLIGFRIAQRIFPDQPSIASGTAALIAFNPMFLFISASVNNDNLTILLSGLAIYLMIRCWQEAGGLLDRSGWVRRVVLGIVLGLAALSKISGLTLLPIVCLMLTVHHLRRREWREWIASGVILGVLVIVIAGWWYVRNQQLYGDWLGLNTMVAVAGPRVSPLTLSQLVGEFDGFRYSYWALFGAVNILTFSAAYVVFDAFTLIALCGWLWWMVFAWRRSDRERSILLGLLALYAGSVFIGVINWTMRTPASQGRLMFPAITVIALLMWLGWETVWSRLNRRLRSAKWLMPAFLVVTAAIIPVRDIIPTYAGPTAVTADQLPTDLRRLNVDYGQRLRLIGYQLPASTSADLSLQFTLYWQCLASPSADLSVFAIVYGRTQSEVGKRDAYPYHGLYATQACKPDMIFVDPYRIPIKADALRPTVLRIQIGLKDWQDNLELAPSAGGKQIPALLFTAGKLAPGPLDLPTSSQYHWRLGDQIELIAGSVPDQVRAGENLSIKLYWQALSTVTESYTVFVHVLDTQGNIVAQTDGLPVYADYPTDWWSSGEMIEDEHQIALPATLPASQYRLAIGLYRLADLSRLPVTDATGQLQPDDQIILPGPLQVRP